MKVKLPQLLWYENNDLEIDLPDSWDVEICPMQGAYAPPLSRQQLKDGILAPHRHETVRELAAREKISRDHLRRYDPAHQAR